MRFLLIAVLSVLLASPAASDSMKVGKFTSQPVGHYGFCEVHPQECDIWSFDQRRVRFTDSLWRLLASVNDTVNRSIKAASDRDIYGIDEVWTYPDQGVGDCEDYVLLKRRMLHERGITLPNLLITVVRKPDGEGHAILTVRTDRGDFILDNLASGVRHWRDTGYKYLKRQSSTYTGQWVNLRHGGNNDHLLVAGR